MTFFSSWLIALAGTLCVVMNCSRQVYTFHNDLLGWGSFLYLFGFKRFPVFLNEKTVEMTQGLRGVGLLPENQS